MGISSYCSIEHIEPCVSKPAGIPVAKLPYVPRDFDDQP